MAIGARNQEIGAELHRPFLQRVADGTAPHIEAAFLDLAAMAPEMRDDLVRGGTVGLVEPAR
jgi:hypothetical protein